MLPHANICGCVSMMTSLCCQARFHYYRTLFVEGNWVSPITCRSFTLLPRLLLSRLFSLRSVSNCKIYEVRGLSVAFSSKRRTRPCSRATHFLLNPASLTTFMIANVCKYFHRLQTSSALSARINSHSKLQPRRARAADAL